MIGDPKLIERFKTKWAFQNKLKLPKSIKLIRLKIQSKVKTRIHNTRKLQLKTKEDMQE